MLDEQTHSYPDHLITHQPYPPAATPPTPAHLSIHAIDRPIIASTASPAQQFHCQAPLNLLTFIFRMRFRPSSVGVACVEAKRTTWFGTILSRSVLEIETVLVLETVTQEAVLQRKCGFTAVNPLTAITNEAAVENFTSGIECQNKRALSLVEHLIGLKSIVYNYRFVETSNRKIITLKSSKHNTCYNYF